jgi:hypothetical protein
LARERKTIWIHNHGKKIQQLVRPVLSRVLYERVSAQLVTVLLRDERLSHRSDPLADVDHAGVWVNQQESAIS